MKAQTDPEDVENELEKRIIMLDNFKEVHMRLKKNYKNISFDKTQECFMYREKILITPNKKTNSVTISEYSPEIIEDLKSNLYIKPKKFNFNI
jgi:hypothetical protein